MDNLAEQMWPHTRQELAQLTVAALEDLIFYRRLAWFGWITAFGLMVAVSLK